MLRRRAGLWDSCVDTYHTNCGWIRSIGDPRLYFLTRGTARITMVLATDDTSIGVPHEKYFPGSAALYSEYITKLQADFVRPDGSSGFTAKGVATEFIGISIDQSVPGRITLDMRKTAESIVKAIGFEHSHPAAAPGRAPPAPTPTAPSAPPPRRAPPAAALGFRCSPAWVSPYILAPSNLLSRQR